MYVNKYFYNSVLLLVGITANLLDNLECSTTSKRLTAWLMINKSNYQFLKKRKTKGYKIYKLSRTNLTVTKFRN